MFIKKYRLWTTFLTKWSKCELKDPNYNSFCFNQFCGVFFEFFFGYYKMFGHFSEWFSCLMDITFFVEFLWDFIVFFLDLLMLKIYIYIVFFKVTKCTTEHKHLPKMSNRSMRSPFVLHEWGKQLVPKTPQELEEGLCRRLYILLLVNGQILRVPSVPSSL